VRRITTLAITLVAAMAAMTTTAQAGETMIVDADSGSACNPCLIENLEGGWDLVSGGSVLTHCDLSFDVVVQATGAASAVNQQSGICSGIQRTPCKNASGNTIQWNGQVFSIWPYPGQDYIAYFDLCFAPVSNPTQGTTQRVYFDVVLDANGNPTAIDKGQAGYIDNADFTNVDHGEGNEVEMLLQ
jgi:hypothetical protein